MKLSYCKLEFHSFGTSKLDTRMSEIKNGIYGNPTIFAAPPLTEAQFETVQNNFSTAAAEYAQ